MSGRVDTLQTVELAEGVEIRLRIAGPLLRARAYLVDWLLRAAFMTVATVVLVMMGIAIEGKFSTGFWLLLWFLTEWFYPVIFEASRWGATPGKRWLGLRVVQTNGSPITLGQAVVRNFMRAADGMPAPMYLAGLAACLSTRRFQRLGDLAAGTLVVYSKVPPQPKIPSPPPLEILAPPVALTPDERRALASFRERAGLWSEGRKIELADLVQDLTEERETRGVQRLLSLAHWLQDRK